MCEGTTSREEVISYAVHVVNQFMAAPRSPRYAVVLRILRYLKGTIFDRLYFFSHISLTLQAYSDADWAGDDRTRPRYPSRVPRVVPPSEVPLYNP